MINLITELKGIANNPLLPKVGEWIIPTTEAASVGYPDKQLVFSINGARGTVISADGVAFDPITLATPTETVTCPNGTYRIHISDKYGITIFSMNGQNDANRTIFDADLSGLAYASGLRLLRVGYSNAKLDVATFAGLSSVVTLEVTNCPNVGGDIKGIANMVSLTSVRFTNTGVYGKLAAINGSAATIEYAYFQNTGVSGDLSELAPLKACLYLLLDNTAVTGTIESVAAAAAAYRNSGTMEVNAKNTAITYNGASIPNKAVITFTGDGNYTVAIE